MNSNDLFVSIDIGTSTVKVIIGEMVKDSLNIIGVGHVKSDGIKKGSIVDIDSTVQSIKKAIEQAERVINMEIKQVIVGIPAHQVSLLDCHGVIAVSGENREITSEDVQRVLDAAQVISIPPEREIIEVVKKQFIVDMQDEINDPRGMIGVRLEVDGTLVTGSRTTLLNILRCVEKAGLEVTDIVLQPLASGEVALSKDEKNLGTALIDIGGGTTTISYYEDGHIQGTTLLPIGGDHITNDIQKVFKTTSQDAEAVKLKYGHAFVEAASTEETFELSIIGSNKKQKCSQYDISEVIEARMAEIFELAYHELRKMGASDLPGGYVLTGGVANMQGVLELAQDLFQNRVRIAIPDYIGVREPQFTTSVGIIKYSYKNARLLGKVTETTVVPIEHKEPRKVKQPTPTKEKQQPEEKITTKMKKFLGSFFE